MDSEKLKQIEEIYHAALEILPGDREAFLNMRCGTDLDLRGQVDSLLSFADTPDDFIDASPESLAVEMFSDSPDHANLTDKTIDRYLVIRLIGRGGMGDVYLAEDTKLGRKVALKILPREFAEDTNRMRRFVREAKSASALNHPNILTIHEINEYQGIHFIATEFIDGETLNNYAKTHQLSLRSMVEIAIQVVSALDEAHSAGIVHRDIKPENVMIRRDGIVKVLDFGLAKPSAGFVPSVRSGQSDDAVQVPFQTQPGLIIGTPNYMSPEQARGKQLDHQTDIFSFGVVLYELLSGSPPFTGETVSDIIAAVLTEEPKRLSDLPPELEQSVYKTLRKNKRDRYRAAKELLNDLKQVLKHLDTNKDDHVKTVSDRKPYSTSDSREPETAIFSSVEPTVSSEPRSGSFLPAIMDRGVLLSVFIFVLLAAGGLMGYRYLTASTQIRSIAVIPFINETGSANSEYLSDGLSDSLINNLSQLPQLKVIARNSSFRYKGKDLDIGEIARALRVQAIVTGRITQHGDNLQMNVELINTADNTRIWGDTYNRKVSASLSLPEEVARAVSEKLELNLTGAQERQMARQLTNSPQAYQLHLNGVFFRRKNGIENIRKAIEYQKQAIALDPDFTRAYVELSINFGNLIDIGAMSPQEGLPQARAAADRALALDDTLADTYYNLARIRKYEFNWTQAGTAFERAIALNPNLAAAHTIYAEYLSELSRFDEALREIKLAQELDPLRTGLVGNEGSIYYLAGQYDEAILKKQIHVDSAPENPFAHLGLANAYVQKGQYAEAILSYQISINLEETSSALIYLGRAYALNGERDKAVSIAERLKSTEKYVSPAELCVLYAALGDKDKAFALLEKAYSERDTQLTSIKVEPGYVPLRDDPRFQDVVRRIGFP